MGANGREKTRWITPQSQHGRFFGPSRGRRPIGASILSPASLWRRSPRQQMATAKLGGFEPHIGFFVFVAGALGFALLGANRFLSSGADSTITPIFAGSLALIAAAGTPHYATLSALL